MKEWKAEWVELTREEMALAYETGKDVIETEMKNNHTGNNKLSKYAGYVGQIAAMKRLKAVNVDDYEYDLEWMGKRIEVKSKICSSIPQANYSATVYASNADQMCDVYLFTRVLRNAFDEDKLEHGAYLLGWIDRDNYDNRFHQVKQGEDDDGYEEPADAFKIQLDQLRAIEELK